mmetsp:Transcript_25906/g.83917  ORF Transcript_25906/g.83917 Transcript_25906/m.83917 type:complete len:339 (-) Transcript_25906:279-1295(-)
MRCLPVSFLTAGSAWLWGRVARCGAEQAELGARTQLEIVGLSSQFVVVDKPAGLRSVPSFGPSEALRAKFAERKKTATEEELLREFSSRKTRHRRFAEAAASMVEYLPQRLRETPLPRSKLKFLRHCEINRMSPEDALRAWEEVSRRVREAERDEGLTESDSVFRRVRDEFELACPVHRIDMQTSGLLCIALHPSSAAHLSRQWAERTVEKTYLALVAGALRGQGDVDLPLKRLDKHAGHPTRMAAADDGKPSLTHYDALTYDAQRDVSLVELTPHTGRLHQLRTHLAAIGHPILGDDMYGGPDDSRLCLHAARLAFDDPDDSNRRLTFSSVQPDFLE